MEAEDEASRPVASPSIEVHDRLRRWWNDDAPTYDHGLSHGLNDDTLAAAWRAALARALPPPGASVLDCGAGTGAISLLAAELGHRVTSLDLSPGMLAQAERKARERGVELRTVIASASEPPDGPFDAVMERHLVWTLPEPAAALAAWRRVAPNGRLVLFEGLWGQKALMPGVKRRTARLVRSLMGVRDDHHGDYGPDLRASLPLADGVTPSALLRVVEQAGWKAARVERLRDVEWAHRLASPLLLGSLEHVARFAIIAEA